jgi:putative DNA primase/helicase
MRASELARLMKARKSSGGWMACCVVHDDSSPSVSITEKNGTILIHCFAGCSTRDILSTLGLTFRDLGRRSGTEWKKRAQTSSVKPAGKKKTLGKQEAIYRYTNEHGELVAEKIRHEGKIFLWRRPQAGGGWIWNIDRGNLPLYMLHEVAGAEVIYLVEGEKDTERLRDIIPYKNRGYIAVTTAPNGALSWRDEYVRWFAGKKVVIFPDSDTPGLAYADNASKILLPIVTSLRVVSVAPDKDVSDYLKNHSPAELGCLIRSTPFMEAIK